MRGAGTKKKLTAAGVQGLLKAPGWLQGQIELDWTKVANRMQR